MGKNRGEIKKLLLDESFQAWISGTATLQEKQRWEAWVKVSPQRQELVKEARLIWESARFLPTELPDIDAEFQQFKNRLSGINPAAFRKTETSSIRPLHRRPSYSNWKTYLVAASVVFALIFTGFYYFYSRYQAKQSWVNIAARFGERKKIHLPDNSTIILNANSRISYQKNWKKQGKRTVYLTGEAYFKVKHLNTVRKNYFSVITADGMVRVLGTEFSVYARDAGTRVSLKQGRVEILIKKSNKNISEVTTLLKPGEMVLFHKGDHSIQAHKENLNIYLDWWKDSFSLQHTPLSQIIQRIEDTYGVHIEVSDSSILQRTLTGTVENQNLHTILEAISNALQIPYHQERSRIILGKSAGRVTHSIRKSS